MSMFLKQGEHEQNSDLFSSLNIIPNKELQEALKEIEDYKNGKIKLDKYNNVNDMFEALSKE